MGRGALLMGREGADHGEGGSWSWGGRELLHAGTPHHQALYSAPLFIGCYEGIFSELRAVDGVCVGIGVGQV